MTQKINIFDTISNDTGSRIKSFEWYMRKIEELRGRGLITKNKLIQYDEMITSRIDIGSMFLMVYANPKYKQTLPFFDAFPLILPFGMDSAHLTAFNLHYIPVKARWILLKQLMQNSEISTVRRASEDARLALDYNLLKGASNYDLLKPCIHQYLYDRIGQLKGGMFLKIPPAEWPIASLLPVQDFRSGNRGYSAERVWKESMGGK